MTMATVLKAPIMTIGPKRTVQSGLITSKEMKNFNSISISGYHIQEVFNFFDLRLTLFTLIFNFKKR